MTQIPRLTLSCAAIMVICMASTPKAQQLGDNYDSLANNLDNKNPKWESLNGLITLLAQHDALDGHALARKSVRSPSRRLRFGRRSDPDMQPAPPMEEIIEMLQMREPRGAVRLRFGRRSLEEPMMHFFPNEDGVTRELRSQSPRLRFGRRSDNNMIVMPFEEKEEKQTIEDQQLKSNA